MAFKITQDQLGDYHAPTGVPVTVGISPTAVGFGWASYNGQKITLTKVGTSTLATFTPLVGAHVLNIVIDPPFPPQAWSIVESDGGATQPVEDEKSTDVVATLFIIGG